jgi:hypothetical protein
VLGEGSVRKDAGRDQGLLFLGKRRKKGYKKRQFCYNETMKMEQESEIIEENRKVRFLRFLVDFSILSIQEDDLSLREAEGIVEEVKRASCGLFPGREETFELIYRPRFRRVLWERFGPGPEEGH